MKYNSFLCEYKNDNINDNIKDNESECPENGTQIPLRQLAERGEAETARRVPEEDGYVRHHILQESTGGFVQTVGEGIIQQTIFRELVMAALFANIEFYNTPDGDIMLKEVGRPARPFRAAIIRPITSTTPPCPRPCCSPTSIAACPSCSP